MEQINGAINKAVKLELTITTYLLRMALLDLCDVEEDAAEAARKVRPRAR
jgi:hypothetical protein